MKRIIISFALLLCAVTTSATTKMYLKLPINSDTRLNQLYGYANPTKSETWSLNIPQTDTAAGGTAIQWTNGAGGSSPALKWISPPLASGVTISGTVTMNTWASESNASANATVAFTVKKYTGGSESTALLTTSSFGTELTTSIANQNWTAAPTSVAFSAGDRIVLIGQLTNAGGTMAAGQTVEIDYGGPNSGADGDAWVQFNENLSFSSEVEYVNLAGGFGVSSTTCQMLSTGSTSGNTWIVVAVWTDQSLTGSMADDQPNTWHSAGSPRNWDTDKRVQMFYADNITVATPGSSGGSQTLTLTLSGTSSSSTCNLYEYKGLATSSFDSSLSSSGTGTNPTSSSLTPSIQPALIVGDIEQSDFGISQPAQQVSRTAAFVDYFLPTSSAQTVSETLLDSVDYGIIIGSFKPSGSVPVSGSYSDSELLFLNF